ncbi:TetR/AcrR family transcriptional regulator [Pontibacillus salipaludis]|uniref:HTH-type transcriptional regulator YhgD n=1 Tax=Pontibacillus salipaludis TaxID=1697394 RepID=A0ABQ1PXY5_9BACI|nr:TetR/AcrR family transcriptional regulator [Pontibacillus salipaludis]GGD06141.1 putative HTH-type transcriptional regulator YhgD [Pontibacillus salipaludis]
MSNERKQQIIKAANQSFATFGYKATTMDHVAKAANVGKGTIYNFFKNKEQLFQEIISNLLLEMKTQAESVIDDQKPLKENVHLALYELLQYRRSHQLTIQMVQEAKEMGTAAVQEALANVEGLITAYLREKIEQAIERGDIRPCHPEMTAFMMFKLYTAFIIDWEERHQPLEKEEIMHLFDEYVFKGLSPS